MNIAQSDVERVIEIAREAGDLVLSMQRAGLEQIESKSNEFDLVTEADLAAEALMRDALASAFPGTGFWGEESNEVPRDEYFWLVDPIDGTVNYARGVPHFSVNIALSQAGKTLMAVTLALPIGTIYWGVAGQGSHVRHGKDDARLRVNTVARLRDGLLSTGFPYTRAETIDNNSMEFAYFMPRCQGVRRMGTAAVDLALVASGVFAAHWEGDLNPWDIAAGALLIREAGGRVTNYAGEEWTHADRQFIASNGNPQLHASMISGIARTRALLQELGAHD